MFNGSGMSVGVMSNSSGRSLEKKEIRGGLQGSLYTTL